MRVRVGSDDTRYAIAETAVENVSRTYALRPATGDFLAPPYQAGMELVATASLW